MEAFSAQQRERFEEEMTVYVARKYPEESATMADGALRALIHDGVDKARAYDIILEGDVARYIEFMVILGPDFDESENTAWAPAILKNRSATAKSKLDEIWFRMCEQQANDEASPTEEGV